MIFYSWPIFMSTALSVISFLACRFISRIDWLLKCGKVELHKIVQTDYVSFPYSPPLIGMGIAVVITALQIIGSSIAAMSGQKSIGIMDGLRREAA